MPKVTVHRKAHFNAAHRLFNAKWSDEKNYEILENVAILIIMGIIMN